MWSFGFRLCARRGEWATLEESAERMAALLIAEEGQEAQHLSGAAQAVIQAKRDKKLKHKQCKKERKLAQNAPAGEASGQVRADRAIYCIVNERLFLYIYTTSIYIHIYICIYI
jgi:hypothetical protein